MQKRWILSPLVASMSMLILTASRCHDDESGKAAAGGSHGQPPTMGAVGAVDEETEKHLPPAEAAPGEAMAPPPDGRQFMEPGSEEGKESEEHLIEQ